MFKKETNAGKDNSGYWNSGDRNSGNGNSGYGNSGYGNSGNRNSGNGNSGNGNSGYGNSGNGNSGDWNSGNGNSGNRNSGDWNSGNGNSGNGNSGNGNSGNYNLGNYNNGFFNLDEPTIRLFGKDTGKLRKDICIPYIELKVTEWISDDKMTDTQKKDDPQFHIKGGTLIKRTYKDAWTLAWSEATPKLKQQFLDLPNFDADIFKEITGIDVVKNDKSCDGKIIEIDGKKYKLAEVK